VVFAIEIVASKPASTLATASGQSGINSQPALHLSAMLWLPP
jgi:hypothetical protein